MHYTNIKLRSFKVLNRRIQQSRSTREVCAVPCGREEQRVQPGEGCWGTPGLPAVSRSHLTPGTSRNILNTSTPALLSLFPQVWIDGQCISRQTHICRNICSTDKIHRSGQITSLQRMEERHHGTGHCSGMQLSISLCVLDAL